MDKIKERKEVDNKYKWDLTKMYKTESEIDSDINKVKNMTNDLISLKGKITKTSRNLLDALNLYFDINRKLEKLYCYANLKFNEDMNVSASQILVGKMEKLYFEISSSVSFLMPEILKSDYKTIEDYLKENKELETYKFSLSDLFRQKEHTLSEKEEQLLAKAGNVIGSSSSTYQMLTDTDLTFSKIHDEEGNLIEFNESKYNKYVKSFNRQTRKEAFESILTEYKAFLNTITETLKGSLKADSFAADVRKYKSVLEMELSGDNITPLLYDKLLKEVTDNINISHKYITLKKDILGLDDLHLYDVYTPLAKDIDKKYTYEEAKELILKALAPLGKDYINDLKTIMDSNCIDVLNNKGKASGAYSSGCFDSLPYVLTNFEGTFNDVSTLAHELGHSMHTFYSNSNNPYHDSSYPIFLAEIASTVNEMLLNRYCINNAKSKAEKLFFLNNLLDEIKACLIRQTMFAEFEKTIHELDEKGNVITGEEASNIYYDLNKKYYGNDIIYDDLIKYEWARIPHFYTSFYVYKYATGISSALYVSDEILKGNKDVLKNYLKFLKSGGKDYPLNILKNVGIDIVNDDTIKKALKVFDNTIDEFRKIYNE